MVDTLTPVLSQHWETERSWTLDAYEQVDGYAGLKARWRWSRARSSSWSRTPACAAAAARASRPA